MGTPVLRYHVTALKRDAEKQWTLFDKITLDEMTMALPAGQFEFAVIYDLDKKKIGYWSKEKGIVFCPPKKKKNKKKKKVRNPNNPIKEVRNSNNSANDI